MFLHNLVNILVTGVFFFNPDGKLEFIVKIDISIQSSLLQNPNPN